MRGRKIALVQRLVVCAIALLSLSSFSHGFSSQPKKYAQPPRSRIPEDVVQEQLNLLQSFAVKESFAYNSENNQAVTGPWKSFAVSLADAPFRSLLGHAESTVLMTISHNGGDYVCCLVKVVPGKSPLPPDLSSIIQQSREAMIASEEEGVLDTVDEDDEDVDDADAAVRSKGRANNRACELFWCEVSKQFDSDKDETEDNFYYRVDSLLPDAEDLDLDYMETTLFAIGDEGDDEEDDDDWSGFLLF